MNSHFVFEVKWKGADWSSTIVARTAAAARYRFYLNCDPADSYAKCFQFICSKKVGVARLEDRFGDQEMFDRMCQHRRLDFAYMGMTVDVDGEKGIMVGSNSSMNLDVLFPGKEVASNCHPHWETTYYDRDGKVVKCYKMKQLAEAAGNGN